MTAASELPVRGTIDEWAHLAAAPAVMFVGGPVASSAVIAVARARLDEVDDQWIPLVGALGTVDLELAPGTVPGVEEVRLFAGYATIMERAAQRQFVRGRRAETGDGTVGVRLPTVPVR